MSKYNLILETLPFEHYDNLTDEVIEIKRENPEFLNENINSISIKHIYQYCLWSHNHSDYEYHPYEYIEANIHKNKDSNIGIYFEFENTKLEKEHFYDRYSNIILEIAKNITELKAFVHNDNLALYLKEKYPKFEIIKSAENNEISIEPPFKARAIDYKTYLANKEKIDLNTNEYYLYINSFCMNCNKCFDFYSECKINFNEKAPYPCNNIFDEFKTSQKNGLFVDNEKIMSLSNEGINNFIVKANTDNKYEILECYLYYLIKPEFRDYVRLKLLKNIFIQKH